VTVEDARVELGVSPRAGQAAIRSAFRRLALRHHPDHNPGRPEAAERFHRICIAYEILRGARAPEPSRPAEPRQRPWSRPWPRARAAPTEPPAPRPEKWPSGAAIHYPTPEEIAALDAPRTAGTRRGAIIFLLALASILGLLMFLEAMSGRPPEPLDPLRSKLRQDLGHRW
jgi:hypothetical protein